MDTSDDSPSDTISVDTGDEGSPLYPGTNVSRRETFSDCPNLLLESSVDDNSSSGKLNLIYITFLLSKLNVACCFGTSNSFTVRNLPFDPALKLLHSLIIDKKRDVS